MENTINILYYITNGLVILWMTLAGVSIFLKKEFIHTAITRLGYPPYFAYILGAAKLIGVILLLLPLPNLFKIVVYTGATIELLSATISYYIIDKKFSEWIKPIVNIIIVWAAYAFWRLHNDLPIFG